MLRTILGNCLRPRCPKTTTVSKKPSSGSVSRPNVIRKTGIKTSSKPIFGFQKHHSYSSSKVLYYSASKVNIPERFQEPFQGPQDESQDRDGIERACRKGIELRESGDFEGALAMFCRAIDLSNEMSYRAYSLRADLYQTTEKPDLALSDYQRVLSLLPAHVPTYTSIASCHKKLGQYELALRQFDHILSLEPTYALAMVGKAECHALLGQHLQAVEYYTKALEQNDKFVPVPHVLQVLGDSLVLTNRLEEAITAYETSLKQNPTNPVCWGSYGAVLYMAKQHAKAADAFSEAIRQGGTPRYDLLAKRASCYLHFENLEKASKDCDDALAEYPNFYKALLIRGQCRMAVGNLREAVEDYGKFIATADQELNDVVRASAEAMSQHWHQIAAVHAIRAGCHLQLYLSEMEQSTGKAPPVEELMARTPPSMPQSEIVKLFELVQPILPLVKNEDITKAFEDLVRARKLNMNDPSIMPTLHLMKEVLEWKFNIEKGPKKAAPKSQEKKNPKKRA